MGRARMARRDTTDIMKGKTHEHHEISRSA
jgi:hypothetical protein